MRLNLYLLNCELNWTILRAVLVDHKEQIVRVGFGVAHTDLFGF